MTDLHSKVLALCREDVFFVPTWKLLNDVGNTFPVLRIKDPLRNWWVAHRLESLRDEQSPAVAEAANAAFLNANGVSLDDDIDLNF